MSWSALLLAAHLGAVPPPSPALADSEPVHLGFSLAVTHTAELDELRRDQQDPGSPRYHRWLTPEEYGVRFGQPAATYGAFTSWLRAQGFAVTEHPNRTFLEATGTAGGVRRLLGVHLSHLAGQPGGVHVPDGKPRLPGALAAAVVHISGLDTRVRFRHRLAESGGYPNVLGPQDLRRFYDLDPVLDGGYVGQKQQLVVLSEAEPPATAVSPQAIQYFLSNVSDSRSPLIYDTLPNPAQDVDPGGAGNEEFEPDVELQSVGAPGALSLTLVISPASEVFTTGANEIATHLPEATAVSISLGLCEQAEQQFLPTEITALRNLVIQGTMEGQTWSAATGDTGSDDCQDNQTVAVDFPASIPEMVAMGGSQITNPSFDANAAIGAYQQEVVWNEPNNQAGAGGGVSVVFPQPAYQAGMGFSGRSVPDLVLLAGNPGVAADSSNLFIQVPLTGQLTPFEGTSASSPLSAGFFALLASRVGCRLGDPHAALYALGHGQFDGGPVVFHDITSGTVALNGVAGASAKVGYDSASGWGSFDLAAMAAAWPPCPPPDAGVDFDGGIAPEAAYSQCALLACDGGVACVTLPEGPSSCEVACSTSAPCGAGELCTGHTLFSDAGLCLPGCATDADCPADAGLVCNTCDQTCVPPGAPDAGVGDACQGPYDCQSSALCFTQDLVGNTWPGGYCTTYCDPSGALSSCGCPSGSFCSPSMFLCLAPCPAPGLAGCRDGYVCQPDGTVNDCQVPCSTSQGFDTCQIFGGSLACDTASGVCGGPKVYPDGGAIGSGSSSSSSASSSHSSSSSSQSSSSSHSSSSHSSTSTSHSSTSTSPSGSSSSSGTTASSSATSTTAASTSSSSTHATATTSASSASSAGGKKSGCGCGSGGDPSSLALLGLGLLAWKRRRSAVSAR